MAPGKKKTVLLLLFLYFSGLRAFSANAYLPPEDGRETSVNEESPAAINLAGILIISFFSLLMITYVIALNKERRRSSFLLKNAAEDILILDRYGKVLECVTGNLDIKSIYEFADREEINRVDSLLQECVKDRSGELFRQLIHQESPKLTRYYQLTLQNMYHRREIRGIIMTVLDVSEAKYLEHELIASREQAYNEARHDMLTNMPNRLYFKEVVSRKFARLERNRDETMCLLMIDLDHFKRVNDTWGHDVGDIVLKKLSVICSAEIRGSDIFARYGGEEFIVFLDDLNLTEGARVAERMRSKVEKNRDWPDGVSLTISIGAAEYQREESLKSLIKKADIALYSAKARGRNQVCLSTRPLDPSLANSPNF